ncbi:DUF4331 family protein [Streptomyces sp. NPDC053542]|uniref:DUF4331 family protein n=1 Tax=Streptomyces sp. NPDC053542 TaxID=3365710 RepID=UPI0037CDE863
MADHNDPNCVNSIFADIDPSPADLYDMFGFPGPDLAHETVVLASTFASVPQAGELDPDMLYRMLVHPRRRAGGWPNGFDLEGMVRYVDGVRERLTSPQQNGDIRAWVDDRQTAHLTLTGFVGGDISETVPTNTVTSIRTPGGEHIRVFVGGRDDAFFNDLPGFFRSINYAPQYYHVPHDSPAELREVPIPKTLLELEGNHYFNYDPAQPNWGRGEKRDLPAEPMIWTGDRFAKDADGNYRLVYSGQDAQAGQNVNCVVLEIPLGYLTRDPDADRVVDVWAESWVRRAVGKVPLLPEEPLMSEQPWAFLKEAEQDPQLREYKRVDTTAQPFADAALNEREDSRQVGGKNFMLAPHFIKRLAHLGWGFGPSITALGLPSAFDHDDAPVSVHKVYRSVASAFPRARKVLFQELRMPDDNWNPKGLDIPLRRPVEIFIPNVCAIDMDTTGTWPFGRRLEDQVATRFLSMFLDMDADIAGRRCHVESLNIQALWDSAPVVPKTPPNPLANDKEFLADFPYLAPPW